MKKSANLITAAILVLFPFVSSASVSSVTINSVTPSTQVVAQEITVNFTYCVDAFEESRFALAISKYSTFQPCSTTGQFIKVSEAGIDLGFAGSWVGEPSFAGGYDMNDSLSTLHCETVEWVLHVPTGPIDPYAQYYVVVGGRVNYADCGQIESQDSFPIVIDILTPYPTRTATPTVTHTVSETMTPVIGLEKSVVGGIFVGGDTITFSINYQNTTGTDYSNYTVYDTLPTYSDFIGASPAPASVVPGTGSYSNVTFVTWNLGTLPAGDSGNILCWIRRPGSISAGMMRQNCVIDSEGWSDCISFWAATQTATRTRTQTLTETFTRTITATPSYNETTGSATPTRTLTETWTWTFDPGTPVFTATPTPTNSPNITAPCWVDVDGNSLESVRITTDGINSLSSFALDQNFRPHFVHKDSYGYVKYVRWDGSVMTDADGSGLESSAIGISSYWNDSSPLSLDASGKAGIGAIFGPGNDQIYFKKWNGSQWVNAAGSPVGSTKVAGTAPVSYVTTLLDSSGNPCIAWQESNDVFFLRWNGIEWVDADGSGQESANVSNTGNVYRPCLQMDHSDNPHLSWTDDSSGTYRTYYVRWSGTAWVDADGTGIESREVPYTPGSCFVSVLKLDEADRPHLMWSSSGSLVYLKWNGSSWVDVDGSGITNSIIGNFMLAPVDVDFAVDYDGVPHVAYLYSPTGTVNMVLYYRWNGSAWVDSDGTGTESTVIFSGNTTTAGVRIKLDREGTAHVSWASAGDVYYMKNICGIAAAASPTVTKTITETITVTPTATLTIWPPTPSATRTLTETWTWTVDAGTPVYTATPTITLTPICYPQISVNLVYNQSAADYVLVEITSDQYLSPLPSVRIVPHGNTDNKPEFIYTATLVSAAGPAVYNVIYPKQNAWGDIDYVYVSGVDACGNSFTSSGSYTKETLSKIDVVLFKNIINPEKDERCRIMFNVYAGQAVKVKVHNKTGMAVRVLYDGVAAATGRQEVIWDGRNEKDESVVSGMYLISVDAGKYKAVKKCAVIK